MFATPLTAWPAMRVKSGPPPAYAIAPGAGGFDAARCSTGRTGASAARESAAVCIRPVTTRPATNPATTKTKDRVSRRIMSSASGDVDAPRAAVARLGYRDGENAVLQIGADRVDGNRLGQREGAGEAAMSAFDAVILLARNVAAGRGRARAADDDAAVLGMDLDLVAAQPGEFRRQYVFARRFVEIDRWSPARGVGADQVPELFVEREDVAQWIPAREGHVFHPSTTARGARIGGNRRSSAGCGGSSAVPGQSWRSCACARIA